ncbi:MAG: signal peptidase II [Chloroflexota bacterium]
MYNRAMSGMDSLRRTPWHGPIVRTLPARSLVLAVVVLVLIDQATKAWVMQNVPPRASLPLVGDFLRVAHYANYGAVGGFGYDVPWVVPALVVAAVTLIVLLLLGYRLYAARLGPSWRLQVFLVLAVAALLGTLLDRVRLGYVVDFLNVSGLPVFNIGDLLPNLGIVFVVLEMVAVVKRR